MAALLRRAELGGAFGAVRIKGDAKSGVVLVKVSTLDGQAQLFLPLHNMDGERVWWRKGPDMEVKIESYIHRRLEDDPDLWCVEIEDKQGRHFIDETVDI